jgi:hypothetical protein
MGAIARSIANNITTSGVFTSSAITNSSVTGITELANATDGITLISSQTASNSASISFTSGLTSTYKAYKFVFSNVHPRNDDVGFSFNLSIDSGSNYNVTKTSTYFRAYNTEDGSAATLGYEDHDLAQSTGEEKITVADVGNGLDESISGTMLLFNPASTVYVKHYISRVNYYHRGNLTVDSYKSGYANTTSAVNAVRFQMSSGNIDGTIYLYGIK